MSGLDVWNMLTIDDRPRFLKSLVKMECDNVIEKIILRSEANTE